MTPKLWTLLINLRLETGFGTGNAIIVLPSPCCFNTQTGLRSTGNLKLWSTGRTTVVDFNFHGIYQKMGLSTHGFAWWYQWYVGIKVVRA